MYTKEVELILARAVKYAFTQKINMLTLEILLYSMLENESIKEVLSPLCNIKELDNALAKNIIESKYKYEEPKQLNEIKVSNQTGRLIQKMIFRLQSGEKTRLAYPEDLLFNMMDDIYSNIYFMLSEQGLEKDLLIKVKRNK
jgi:ATP-dependent Clp protease ATP-binding subunit ClpA